MGISINNASNGNYYSSLITSKDKNQNIYKTKTQDDEKTQKLQDDKKSEQKINKKKQITSEQEGNYLCTYLTDDDGKKILLNKIPISQINIQNNSSANENTFSNLMSIGSSSTFENQLNLESNYRKNSKEIANILKINTNHYDSSRELKELLSTLKS